MSFSPRSSAGKFSGQERNHFELGGGGGVYLVRKTCPDPAGRVPMRPHACTDTCTRLTNLRLMKACIIRARGEAQNHTCLNGCRELS